VGSIDGKLHAYVLTPDAPIPASGQTAVYPNPALAIEPNSRVVLQVLPAIVDRPADAVSSVPEGLTHTHLPRHDARAAPIARQSRGAASEGWADPVIDVLTWLT